MEKNSSSGQASPPADFNLPRLLREVFDPRPGESALIMVDVPRDGVPDNPAWRSRRRMAREWRNAFPGCGLPLPPILLFPATGAHNAPLPATGLLDGKEKRSIAETVTAFNIVLAMTEFSATAPLSAFARPGPGGCRIASMPGVSPAMQHTALAADYRRIARVADRLARLLNDAESARVVFSTGDVFVFDLRHRRGHADGGRCTPDTDFPLINLPGGEAYIAPYEGERPSDPSRTAGILPVLREGRILRLEVSANRVRAVHGDGAPARELQRFFACDPARRNIAELGLGCNEKAVVSGNIIEDEKTGFHWACGRSDHLGGTVGPAGFTNRECIVHQDEVYPPGGKLTVQSLVLSFPQNHSLELIRNGTLISDPSYPPE